MPTLKTGKLHLISPSSWGVFLDKRYSKYHRSFCVVISKKNPSNATMTNLAKSKSSYILHDRLVVESVLVGCAHLVHLRRNGAGIKAILEPFSDQNAPIKHKHLF